jgi:ubiquinone/menaquinone biosynthesis C-methylase UbiE
MGKMGNPQIIKNHTSIPKIAYLDIQAYIGATKHLGGLDATKDLIKLCKISEKTHVLDIGCGTGATACYLGKQYGCRVTGIDIREGMIKRAKEMAKDEKVEKNTTFRVADAQELPFTDEMFDTVICESVATFIEDKQRIVDQCVQVTKKGGYIGFNEEVWVKTPPTGEYMEFMRSKMDVEPEIPTADDWERYLKNAGLQNIIVHVFEYLDPGRESSQKKRYSLNQYIRIIARTIWLYVNNKKYREYKAEMKKMPNGLFEHIGYGIFVGLK